MQCPECSAARTYVSTTMVHPSGGVHRYRKCSGCGFNFATLETILEEKPKLGRPVSVERVATPKLKNTVTKRDAALINKIKVEVRRKAEDKKSQVSSYYIEDDFDGDY